MSRFCLVFISLFLFANSFAQFEIGLKLKGKIQDENKNALDSVRVRVLIGDKDSSIYLSANGEIEFIQDVKTDMILEFHRKGYFTKKIQSNTQLPKADQNRLWNFQFELNLLPIIPGLDSRILNKPIALLAFDRQLRNFVSLESYLHSIQDDLNTFEESYRARKAQYYEELLTDADKYISKKEYKEAEKSYSIAQAFKPKENDLTKRIVKLKGLMHREKVRNRIFFKTLAEGEVAFNKQDYAEAKKLFLRAQRMNPRDPYLKQKLKDVRALMEGKNTSEIKPENSKEAQFENYMKLADVAINRKDVVLARNYLREAMKLKPGATEPVLKINEVNQISNEIQRKRIEQLGQEFIQANELFEEGDYASAQILYKKLVEENYKREICEKHLAEISKHQKMDVQKFIQKLTKEEQFDLMSNKGDSCFTQSAYMEASEYYEQALEIFPAAGQVKLKFQEAIKRNMNEEENVRNKMFDFVQETWLNEQLEKKRLKEGYNEFSFRKGKIRIECMLIKQEQEQDYYLKVMHTWGGVFYFEKEKNITQVSYREIRNKYKKEVFIR